MDVDDGAMALAPSTECGKLGFRGAAVPKPLGSAGMVELAAFGFAIQTFTLACIWSLWLDAAWINAAWATPIFDATLTSPWTGIVGILCISLAVWAVLQRSRARDTWQWAAVVAAGVVLHLVILLTRSVATHYRWHMNVYGKPFGLLAVVIPSGHLFGQLAILVGVLGVLATLRTHRNS